MKITTWISLLFLTLALSAQQAPRLLILTTKDFSRSAGAIQQHKRMYGMATEILWAETVNGFPSPEELQAALRDRQYHFAFDHLLLLGDGQHIPPFSGIQGTIHDHGYSLADDTDYLPDWSVGRLSFPDDQAAFSWWQRQVEKRQSLYHGGTALVSVSALNRDDAEGLQITDSLIHRGLSVDLYRQTQQTHDGQAIMAALEKGTAWAIYYGHGDAVGWNSLQPGISSATLAQAALALPTLVLSAACDNANYAYPHGAALGEQFLAAGAMGFVGCTGQCLYDYSDTVTKYTLYRYLEAPHRTIGEALKLAKLDAYSAFHKQSETFTELTLQHFVLLGDPTARPPVAPLQRADYTTHGAKVCVPNPSIFWRLHSDTVQLAQGYAVSGNTCLTPADSANRLSVTGRQIAPAQWPLGTIPTAERAYPNPVAAGGTITWPQTGASARFFWIATDGQRQFIGYNPALITAPEQPGLWLLEQQIADGSRLTETIIVVP